MKADKELPELPTALSAIFWQNEMYTTDQLKAYGAACAAHAREVALSEAVRVCDAFGKEWYCQSTTSEVCDAIEALKKAGK